MKSYIGFICAEVDTHERPWTVKTHMQWTVTKSILLRSQRSAYVSFTHLLVYFTVVIKISASSAYLISFKSDHPQYVYSCSYEVVNF